MKTQNSTDTRPEASTGSSAWRLVKRAAGYLLAMACLVWVFHDIHVERLFREMTSIRWGIIPLAVIADALGYCSQGVRWRLLLRPVGKINAWRTTQAVYAGLFTSEVLPLRAGELVRGFLVSRWLSVRLISIIPSMVVERLLDGVWLALGIGLAALAVQLPRSIIVAADVLGTVVLLGTVLFMYLVLHRRRPPAEKPSRAIATWRPVRLLVTFIDRIAGGQALASHDGTSLWVMGLADRKVKEAFKLDEGRFYDVVHDQPNGRAMLVADGLVVAVDPLSGRTAREIWSLGDTQMILGWTQKGYWYSTCSGDPGQRIRLGLTPYATEGGAQK